MLNDQLISSDANHSIFCRIPPFWIENIDLGYVIHVIECELLTKPFPA